MVKIPSLRVALQKRIGKSVIRCRYIFCAALRKILELTEAVISLQGKSSLRVDLKKSYREATAKSLFNHWFSIHFSPLRFEKHSN